MTRPHAPADNPILSALRLTADGLVPVITQDRSTGEVLMMAWMNQEALAETLATGRMVYWSRSRNELWRKGDTSGQVQVLAELRLDCDGDAVLALVDQTGVACHTGRRTCFYRTAQNGEWVDREVPMIDPRTLYGDKAAKPD